MSSRTFSRNMKILKKKREKKQTLRLLNMRKNVWVKLNSDLWVLWAGQVIKPVQRASWGILLQSYCISSAVIIRVKKQTAKIISRNQNQAKIGPQQTLQGLISPVTGKTSIQANLGFLISAWNFWWTYLLRWCAGFWRLVTGTGWSKHSYFHTNQKFIGENLAQILQWPANFLDINPVENECTMVKCFSEKINSLA